jgi:hypothetical protein
MKFNELLNEGKGFDSRCVTLKKRISSRLFPMLDELRKECQRISKAAVLADDSDDLPKEKRNAVIQNMDGLADMMWELKETILHNEAYVYPTGSPTTNFKHLE